MGVGVGVGAGFDVGLCAKVDHFTQWHDDCGDMGFIDRGVTELDFRVRSYTYLIVFPDLKLRWPDRVKENFHDLLLVCRVLDQERGHAKSSLYSNYTCL